MKTFSQPISTRILYLAFFVFYSWLACNGQFSDYKWSSTAPDYVSAQAQAFANGQISLLIEPNPELLKLQDPYDPKLNEPYRLHDASLYGGKYYLYFSPTISLFFALPFYLATGHFFPQKVFCLIFTFLNFLLLVRISKLLLIQFNKKSYNFLILTLGIISPLPYFLGRIEVYETIISAGIFFLLSSVYLFLRIVIDRLNYRSYFFLGVLLGIMVSLRPNLIVSCGAIIFAVSLNVKQCKLKFLEKFRAHFLIFFPISLSLVIMLIYNWYRFNDIFEFGLRYQLAGANMQNVKFYNPINFPANFLSQVFNPLARDFNFPFFHVSPRSNLGRYDSGASSEAFYGLFSVPLSWLLLLPASRNFRAHISKFSLKGLYFLLAIGGINIFQSSLAAGTTNRYSLEYLPFFLIVQVVVFFHLISLRQSLSPSRRSSDKLLSSTSIHILLIPVLTIWTISFIMFFLSSLDGYSSRLANRSPHQFMFIQSLFQLPIKLIAYLSGLG